MVKVFSILTAVVVGASLAIDSYNQRLTGAFHGDPDYAAETARYSRTKEEAEKILRDYLEKENRAGEYSYFPYQITYAYEGGYLFVVGEFKLSIQIMGFYVDPQGVVSFRDLRKAISVEDYKGSRQ